MPTHRTRPLPGMVLTLIAIPTAAWVTLIVVVWVLAALDQDPPFGGFWSIGIAIAVTTALGCFGIWAYDRLRAGQRDLLAKLAEMDRTEPLPRMRIVATVPAPTPADCAPALPLPDNVRSFELGRQVGRKERDN